MGIHVSRWGRLPGLVGVAFSVALAVAACGSASSSASGGTPPPTATQTPTPTPTPTPTSVPTAPTVTSVTMGVSALDSSWIATFKKPVVSGIPDSVATTMNAAIQAKVNGLITAFTGMGLPTVLSGDGPSTLDGEFTIALDSPTLLSLRFKATEYASGAASTFDQVSSINFVVSTGAVIALADLFTTGAAALPVLTSKSHALLLANPDYGGDLTWPPTPALSFFATGWVFTTSGLELTWNQGDIAPMAAVDPSVNIPWLDLNSVLNASGPAAEFM